MQLDLIQNLISEDLEFIQRRIHHCLDGNIPQIQQPGQHLLQNKGKLFRPTLLVLLSHFFEKNNPKITVLGAAVELIHIASLMHDDVVDEAKMRRGEKTVNTIWGNRTAILVGDVLYSTALQEVVHLQDIDLITPPMTAIRNMAEGEIEQHSLTLDEKLNASEEMHFRTIYKKTATLFEAAAEISVIATCASKEYCPLAKQLGFHLGMAFQLADDTLDFQGHIHSLGKNAGNDILEEKVTLPALHFLNNAAEDDRQLLIESYRAKDILNLPTILSIMNKLGTFEYCQKIADYHQEKALELLGEFPKNRYNEALYELIKLATLRNH